MKKFVVHSSILHFFRKRKCVIAFLAAICLLGFSTCIYAQSEGKGEVHDTFESVKDALYSLDAEALYGLRNPYVGDASADGRLLYELEDIVPSGSYKIELDTDEPPYVLRLAFEEEPLEGTDEASHRMNVAGTLLLALIDNLDEVQWTYPTKADGEDVFYTGYWNLNSVADNYSCTAEEVKKFGSSKENLQGLLDKLSESISVVGGVDGPTSISIALAESK